MAHPKIALRTWLLLGATLLVLFFLRLLIGSVPVEIGDVWAALSGRHTPGSDLVAKFRLPVAVTCVFAGAGLSASGLMMQTLFRNALAGPDVLGLTSGSSLLVALVILAGGGVVGGIGGSWTLAIAASLGSAGVFLLILLISQYVYDNTSLLIIGLMIGATTGSIVGVLQYVSQADDLQSFVIWGLGNVGSTSWSEILVLGVIVVTGSAVAIGLMKQLNALLLGEDYANTLGIDVRKSRIAILTATSIMTGGVTAFCGPIAFVGLAVPHLVRLLIPSSNHKVLLPAVLLGGGILLLSCDILAQLPGSTQVLPLNAVTSIIGAPVVIWLVIRNRKVNV